jgi:hypothetical protein
MRGGSNWFADNCVDIQQPLPGDSAVRRFVDRFGPGMHSYAAQVADLDGTIARLIAGGVEISVRDSIHGENFCFTNPRTTGDLLFEWCDYNDPRDPRNGAKLPSLGTTPVLDIAFHAYVGAIVPDPVGWAERYGPLFGFQEAFRDPTAPAGRPLVGLAVPDMILALYSMPAADSEALWGRNYGRPQFHLLGLAVPDLEEASRVVGHAGIDLVRTSEHELVLDARQTGEVPLVLVDRPLPGDPRF